MRSVALNRHVLPFALALIAGALFAPSPVHGVTLGNVASLSALGHPLRIVIPVALSAGETLHIACVKLVADNNASGAPQIVTGRVNLEQATNGLRLLITSPVSVSEPALRLAVQVGCGSTTRRDYVLFLDPPTNELPSAIAAADTEDPAWTRVTREHVAVAAAKPRQSVAAAPSPLPPTTWGTPVPTSPTIDEARPKAPDKIAPEPKVGAPVIAAAATTPGELTVVSSSGGFISEAAASPLPLRAPATKAAASQSYPLSGQGPGAWRSQPQPPAASVWQVMWPYASVIFGTMGLGLLALILHRRRVIKPLWMDPKTRTTLGAETQAGAPQATVAHFGAMTESGKASRRASLKLPDTTERSAEVSELDTLLQDIQADMIDERSVKEAWKSAAGDSPLDMGTDSILKAIAAAEHSLQIGAPEPSQVALDRALDKDLMTIPQAPKGVRFG